MPLKGLPQAGWHNYIGGKARNKKHSIMKISRLLAYGAAGIIAGLLIENRSINLKDEIACKARQLKKKAADLKAKMA